MLIWILILPCAVTTAATLLLLRLGATPMDRPNSRSLHDQPIPRIGGVALMIGASVGWLIGHPGAVAPLAWLSIGLGAFCLIDDVRSLPVVLRLAAQLCAAGAALWLGPIAPASLPLAAVLMLVVVWGANLYNFMDGSNGLAGGMTLFGFGFLALGAWLAGAQGYLELCAAVSSAALGFLFFNFDPARIFMGDAGSVPVGFLAATVGLSGYLTGIWNWTFPVLIFLPFIADSSVTLLKRLLRRERVWRAHREHYYQRLVRIGLKHRGAALLAYTLMLAGGCAAIYTRNSSAVTQRGVLVAFACCYFVSMAAFDAKWRRTGLPP